MNSRENNDDTRTHTHTKQRIEKISNYIPTAQLGFRQAFKKRHSIPTLIRIHIRFIFSSFFFFAPFYFWGCSSPRSASKRKRGDQSNWLRLFMPLVPHSFWGYRSACGTHPSIYIFYSTYISTSFYHDTANVVERVMHTYTIIEMWRHSPHRQDVHTRHISKA